MRIHIVGAGLIGTSIGLGLTQLGDLVTFEDSNPDHLRVAQDLVDPQNVEAKSTPIDLVILSTPVEVLFDTLQAQFSQNPQSMFIDVSGLKSELIQQVESFPDLASRFCGTHPMAGREISGPTGARSDLFQGAVWIVTPTSRTDERVVSTATSLAKSLGASVRIVEAEAHDRAISAVSHLPQVFSSLLAQTLHQSSAEDLSLAGQGIRDLTRLADSSPSLWSELLLHNKKNLLKSLATVQASIAKLISDVENDDKKAVFDLLKVGSAGKSLIPGKHGGIARAYAYLPIVIDDKPGQLAAIFDECANAKVNVEDLFIEHSPGQQTGLITLALSQDDANILRSHLVEKNWRVHEIRASR